MDTKIRQPMPAPAKEIELIKQVGEWSKFNFGDSRKPELGVVEEIGEAAHCVLKRLQKIRGYDSEETFEKDFTDALADAVIFLCDWCNLHNTFFQFTNLPEMPADGANEDRIVAHLLQTCSVLFGQGVDEQEENPINRMAAQRIVNALNYWGVMYSINLSLCVTLTWAKVRKRNWKKNPDAPEPEHA